MSDEDIVIGTLGEFNRFSLTFYLEDNLIYFLLQLFVIQMEISIVLFENSFLNEQVVFVNFKISELELPLDCLLSQFFIIIKNSF